MYTIIILIILVSILVLSNAKINLYTKGIYPVLNLVFQMSFVYVNVRVVLFFLVAFNLYYLTPLLMVAIAYINMHVHSIMLDKEVANRTIIKQLIWVFAISSVVCIIKYIITDIYNLNLEEFILAISHLTYIIPNTIFLVDTIKLGNLEDIPYNNKTKNPFLFLMEKDNDVTNTSLSSNNPNNPRTPPITEESSSGPASDLSKETEIKNKFIEDENSHKSSLKKDIENIEANRLIRGNINRSKPLVPWTGDNIRSVTSKLRSVPYGKRIQYNEILIKYVERMIDFYSNNNIPSSEKARIHKETHESLKLIDLNLKTMNKYTGSLSETEKTSHLAQYESRKTLVQKSKEFLP